VRDDDFADDEGNAKEPQRKENQRKENQASNAETGGRDWTEEEDQKIQEMKADSKSWKEIVAAVGANKSQIQRRLKELQRAKQGDSKTGVKDSAKKAHVRNEPSPVVQTEGVGLGLDFGCLFGDEDSGVDGGVSSNDAPFSTLTGFDGYKKKKNKKADKEDKELSDPNDLGEESGGDWYSIHAGGEVEDRVDDVEESNHGDEELNQFGYLVADELWSQQDCDILEDLAYMQKKNKWLQLQAEFYNWTGRMVDGKIIKEKFEADGLHFDY
jgi:hypothetical protein